MTKAATARALTLKRCHAMLAHMLTHKNANDASKEYTLCVAVAAAATTRASAGMLEDAVDLACCAFALSLSQPVDLQKQVMRASSAIMNCAGEFDTAAALLTAAAMDKSAPREVVVQWL
jgi:hypothetical protein